MFVNVGRTLASLVGTSAMSGVATLMRSYGVRSFRDKFQKMQFEAAAKHGRSRTRYSTVYHSINGKRECQRRWLQDAYSNQIDSHKPGTVQPRHIFANEARPA